MADTSTPRPDLSSALSAREQALAELEELLKEGEQAREVLERLEAARIRAAGARDAIVRTLAFLGAEKATIARRMRMNRQSVYEAINAPSPVSASAATDARYLDALRDAAEVAYERWRANDHKGEPGDYWPLG